MGCSPGLNSEEEGRKQATYIIGVPASRGWMQWDQVPQAWVGSIRVLPLAEKWDVPTMMGYTLNLKLEQAFFSFRFLLLLSSAIYLVTAMRKVMKADPARYFSPILRLGLTGRAGAACFHTFGRCVFMPSPMGFRRGQPSSQLGLLGKRQY